MSTICSDYVDEDRQTEVSGQRRAETKATGLGPIALRVVSSAIGIVGWPLRVLAARRELEILAQMSEYELKDIGLTSSDLADVTALPADASPTDFLAARVEERHRARYV